MSLSREAVYQAAPAASNSFVLDSAALRLRALQFGRLRRRPGPGSARKDTPTERRHPDMFDDKLPCAQIPVRSHVLAWFPGGRSSGDPAYSGWDLYRAEAWDNGGPMPPRFLTLRGTLGADADELRVLVAHRLGRQAMLSKSQFIVMTEPGVTKTFPCYDVYTLEGP